MLITNQDSDQGELNMKLIISLSFATQLFASSLIQISYSKVNFNKANYIRAHLSKKYRIPKKLIELRVQDCQRLETQNVEFCIEDNGELEIYKKNSELISSLQIFNRPY